MSEYFHLQFLGLGLTTYWSKGSYNVQIAEYASLFVYFTNNFQGDVTSVLLIKLTRKLLKIQHNTYPHARTKQAYVTMVKYSQ